MKKKVLKLMSWAIIIAFLLPFLMPFNKVIANSNSSSTKVASQSIRDYIKPFSDNYIEWLELPEEERNNTIAPQMYERAFVYNTSSGVRSLSSTSLPRKYHLKDDIDVPIRNQARTNTCWAFAAISALETNIALIQGRNVDFSVKHMEYGVTRDLQGGINKLGFNRDLNSGRTSIIFRNTINGNIVGRAADWSSMPYFTNGSGPVLERDMPFENGTDIENERNLPLTTIQSKPVNDKVTEYVYFSNILIQDKLDKKYSEAELTEFRNTIKNHIMNYGAVVASYHACSTFCGAGRARSENLTTSSVYCDNYCNNSSRYGFANHEISIVGWDDDYAVTNFSTSPSKPGAYIIRNSWGIASGDNGYWYISYEDIFIEDDMFGIVSVEEIKDDEKLYQYDALGPSVNIKTGTTANNIGYGANVFSRDSSRIEVLTGIAITNKFKCSYEVYINPANGSLESSALTKVATTRELEAGYNTIKFDTVLLTGSEFAVVVKYNSPESQGYPVSVEHDLATPGGHPVFPEALINSEIFEDNPWRNVEISEKGYISSNGTTWTSIKDADICIKTFTSDPIEGGAGDQPRIVSLGNVSYNPNPIREGTGGTVSLRANTADIEDGIILDVTIRKNGADVSSLFDIINAEVINNRADISINVFEDALKGEYTIEVGNEEFGVKTITFSILDANDPPPPPPEIKGSMIITIKDSTGKEIQGATVTVYEDNVKRSGTLTTNAEGKVTVQNMIKGKEYKIDVAKEGYREQKGVKLPEITTDGQVLTGQLTLVANTTPTPTPTSTPNPGSNTDKDVPKDIPDDTTATKDLPKTGEAIIYFSTINSLAAVAITSFIKMRAIKII